MSKRKISEMSVNISQLDRELDKLSQMSPHIQRHSIHVTFLVGRSEDKQSTFINYINEIIKHFSINVKVSMTDRFYATEYSIQGRDSVGKLCAFLKQIKSKLQILARKGVEESAKIVIDLEEHVDPSPYINKWTRAGFDIDVQDFGTDPGAKRFEITTPEGSKLLVVEPVEGIYYLDGETQSYDSFDAAMKAAGYEDNIMAESTLTFNGYKFKRDKLEQFDTREEVNVFLRRYDDWGYLGRKGGYYWCAPMDYLGE